MFFYFHIHIPFIKIINNIFTVFWKKYTNKKLKHCKKIKRKQFTIKIKNDKMHIEKEGKNMVDKKEK